MLEQFDRAIASTKAVIANIEASQLDGPSPCASWKVRDVLNHVIGSNGFFVAALGGGAPMPGDDRIDYSLGEFQLAFDEASAAARAAFGAPGALEKIAKLPWGERPGAALLGMATTDVFVHGWDLAKATGQPTDLDGSLAEELLAGSQASMNDAFRGPDGSGKPWGPEQQPPASATAADRLAAFLGRVVA